MLFAAGPNAVVGPVPSGDGWDVVLVLETREASLDDATRDVIRQTLLDEWFAERRAGAVIEWFWGTVPSEAV